MENRKIGLTNNQLKLIAMAAMLCDHVGISLLPQYDFLRIIGRLAFPIFAYMIAEGCRYTRDRVKYLLQIALLAALCQVVFYVTSGSLYQSVLVTFTLSVISIFCVDRWRQKKELLSGALALAVLAAVAYVCICLPQRLDGTDFHVDYGFFGVMLPVLVFLMPDRVGKVLCTAVMLIALGYVYGGFQWYGLLTIPLLLLYNETRGKYKLKYLFYIFYPTHLVAIYLIGMLLGKAVTM